MYTVAVTGATGFVGNFVSNYLETKGFKVFRFGRKNKDGILLWDITHGLYAAAPRADCVVHCAADVNDWSSYKKSYSANVQGTINVLRSFPTASKFIYISSASVYDSFCERVIISEDTCLGGKLLNAYSKTKLLGEKEVEKSTIPSKIILRPHIIYGPGDTTIGPRIKGGIKFGHFPVIGNGENRISFTHIENLAQVIWLSIVASKNGLSVYNVTDEEAMTFNKALQSVRALNNLSFKEIHIPHSLALFLGSVFEFMCRILYTKKPPLLTRYIVDQMSSDHAFSIDKVKKELGYRPSKNLQNDFLL